MPSQRKRIGFLPSEEVHEVIEKICIDNKISQSKVTGILVEEALRSRGVLNNRLESSIIGKNDDVENTKKNKNLYLKKDLINDDEFCLKNQIKLEEELRLINQFIEFKFFKKIMNQKTDIED